MSPPKRKPLNTAAFASAAVPQADPVQVATSAKAQAPAPVKGGKTSRADKVQIQGYFPEETRRHLKMLAAQQGRTVEELLGEALTDLFRKHAPR